jgi:multicomponent Na+:H+ antiporter subunit A
MSDRSRVASEGSSTIFASAVRLLFALTLVFSLFLLFSGHNAPGGGFIGGLVAGAAFVLRYIDGGVDEVRRVARMDPVTLIGLGVTLAVLTGFFGLMSGAFLDASKYDIHLGPLGEAHATGALPFDIGVYLVVVGLAITALEAFGEEDDPS